MLTSQDDRNRDGVDEAPAARRLASRGFNWWVALRILCGPAAAAVLVVALSPVLAVLFVGGLAVTCARYVTRRDWAALGHIGAGFGLFVAGYIVARGFVHGGVGTLSAYAADTRDRVDGDPNAASTAWSLAVALGVIGVYVAALVAVCGGSLYALVRPYRTRFSRPVVLAACALAGVGVGFVG
jgi:hypothetical protein